MTEKSQWTCLYEQRGMCQRQQGCFVWLLLFIKRRSVLFLGGQRNSTWHKGQSWFWCMYNKETCIAWFHIKHGLGQRDGDANIITLGYSAWISLEFIKMSVAWLWESWQVIFIQLGQRFKDVCWQVIFIQLGQRFKDVCWQVIFIQLGQRFKDVCWQVIFIQLGQRFKDVCSFSPCQINKQKPRKPCTTEQ